MAELNWVERRDLRDSGLPEFWNLFCIEIQESTLAAFRKSNHARERDVMVVANRFNHCLHIIYARLGAAKPERVIDICLDIEGHGIVSKVEGQQQAALGIGLDAEMKLCMLDSERQPITLDEASALFLEKFLFG